MTPHGESKDFLSMNKTKIRKLVVVGAGSIGRRHARIARTLIPKAEIYVLRHSAGSDIPPEADGCFYDLEDAIAFKPDAAIIANPATCHAQVACRFAANGVHLLVEKPLADRTEAVGDLLDICRRSGIVILVGYNLRFLPSLQHFRSLIAAGFIGYVLCVRAEVGQYLPSWRSNTDYRATVSARKELGGGVLLELSHEIDYLRWIFGEAYWVHAILRRQSSLEIDVEDTAQLTMGLRSASGEPERLVTLNMDFIRRDTTRQCLAIGDKGTLRWNALAGTVEHFKSEADDWSVVFRHTPARDDSYIAEWKHFLACIDDNIVPAISGEDATAVLEIIDAARKSAQTERAVHFHR